MKNILTIESTVSLSNELKLMGISVYEDLHNLLVVDCTIAYNKYSLALKKKKKKKRKKNGWFKKMILWELKSSCMVL
jgi:hypothetical protein